MLSQWSSKFAKVRSTRSSRVSLSPNSPGNTSGALRWPNVAQSRWFDELFAGRARVADPGATSGHGWASRCSASRADPCTAADIQRHECSDGVCSCVYSNLHFQDEVFRSAVIACPYQEQVATLLRMTGLRAIRTRPIENRHQTAGTSLGLPVRRLASIGPARA